MTLSLERCEMPALARALVLTLVAASVPSFANAVTSKYPEQEGKWTASDKCTKRAVEKYPDYTAEDNAKRDAFLRRCLNASGAPGRAPVGSKG
jgi:hypothetical protein